MPEGALTLYYVTHIAS